MKNGRQVLPLAMGCAALMLAGCFGNDDDDDDGNPPPVVQAPTEKECAAVASLPDIENRPEITSAKWVPANTEKASPTAATFLPAHCIVQGAVARRTGVDGLPYAIQFELRLPSQWNGRFFFQGGGGFEGTIPAAYGGTGGASTALEQGFAVVSQNGGHDNATLPSEFAFGFDPQARIDYGYNSVEKTATTAKSLIAGYYGKAISKSYFDGCSTGGRQGMSFAQRFPDYFDGIVAGAPVYDIGQHTVGQITLLQTVAAMVPKDVNGNPEYYKGFSATDGALYTKALLQKCDALDGAVDGMVANTEACDFKPEVLQCTGAKDDTCLSPPQVKLLQQITSGPIDAAGKPFKVPGYQSINETAVTGYLPEPGWMASSGHLPRLFGTATTVPGDFRLGVNPFPYLQITPPDASFDPIKATDWDAFAARMTVNPPWLMSNPDLAKFKEHKGRILFYHGAGDPGPNLVNTINYYKAVANLNGGIPATQEFARLFVVPGMGHCGSGPATDSFDRLAPMMDWVENGKAPERIIASARAANRDLTAVAPPIPANRTRPLCVYPKSAHYLGSGNVDDAASFECR